MAMTAVKGYLRVKAEVEEREKLGMVWDPAALKYVPAGDFLPDRFMQMRLASMKRNALRFRPALSSALKYAPNAAAAEKCRKTMALHDQAFGPMPLLERAKSVAVRILAARESRRIMKEGVVMRQPPTNRVTYPDRSSPCLNEDYLMAGASIASQPEM
jgi:hypothetical protein